MPIEQPNTLAFDQIAVVSNGECPTPTAALNPIEFLMINHRILVR